MNNILNIYKSILISNQILICKMSELIEIFTSNLLRSVGQSMWSETELHMWPIPKELWGQY